VAYIDSDFVNALLEPALVTALFTDSGTYQTARFNTALAYADGMVRAALKSAGYTPPTSAELATLLASSDEDQVGEGNTLRAAAFGAFLKHAVGRKPPLKIPEAYREDIGLVARIQKGDIPFEHLSITERDAVGGVDFTDSSETSDDGIPRLFSRGMGR
jgi:hypothetical protein